MSTKEDFARYEELKGMIKDCEAQLEILKPRIVEAIPEGTDVAGDYGTFSVQSRATWKFSKNHETQKKALKELEEEEKAKGIAKASYSSVLYYKQEVGSEA